MIKIIKSLAIVAFVATIAIGGTIAYLSDTETSPGNTFTAGELDLKIDNECHYNGMVCKLDNAGGYTWQDEDDTNGNEVRTKYEYIGGPCSCSWEAKNLDGEKFYDYKDIKPGDWGEHTLSIHVDDNDAYGRILVTAVENRENNCNDPEGKVDDTCIGRWCGELAQNMYTFSWVDDGMIDGFGDSDDPEEGDNIWQSGEKVLSDADCDGGKVGPNNLFYCPVLLSSTADAVCTAMASDPQGDIPSQFNVTQTTKTGFIAGGVTHYYGTAWFVPATVNNIIQGDSIQADISFEIVQARHNDTGSFNN